jgi:RNA polymerase sigma-70 factor (ECF subfamily)
MIEGTCRHKALSARRRRTEGAELDEKIEATIADPANDPEVALQEKDRGELVRRALMRLTLSPLRGARSTSWQLI